VASTDPGCAVPVPSPPATSSNCPSNVTRFPSMATTPSFAWPYHTRSESTSALKMISYSGIAVPLAETAITANPSPCETTPKDAKVALSQLAASTASSPAKHAKESNTTVSPARVTVALPPHGAGFTRSPSLKSSREHPALAVGSAGSVGSAGVVDEVPAVASEVEVSADVPG